MKLVHLLLSAACLLAANLALAQSRYSYSTDGSEVTDSQTGLIWRRCAEGMSWSGTTCTGIARGYSREAAHAHAQTQSGWRLPNVKELTSIVDISRSYPAIDPMAFPATPSNYFWTSTPYVDNSSNAWYVGFIEGSVQTNSGYNGYLVRLVR